MPADRVEVNYDVLAQIQGKFSQQSDEAQKLDAKIRGQMDVLRGGAWEGKGAQAFYKEMESTILPAVQRLQKALEEGNRVVGQIAQEFRNAEEESGNVWNPF